MWTTFAAAAGAAAAGLTGLTFIVVAFRFDTIAVSREYRNRAAQVLTIFVTVIVTASLLTIPQDTRALGIELALAAGCSGWVLLRLDAAARRGQDNPPRPGLTIALVGFISAIAASGVLLVFGWQPGYYLYAGGALLGLVWGVYGAWVFLTQTAPEPTPTDGD